MTNSFSNKKEQISPAINYVDMRSSSNSAVENFQECNALASSNAILQENLSSEQASQNGGGQQQSVTKDDERDLMALMVASTTIPPPNSKTKNEKTAGSGGMTKGDTKKRVKLQRDVARDLAMLLPDSDVVREEKAFGYAQSYYLKVKDRLDEQSFSLFIRILNSFESNGGKVPDLYNDIMSILKPHQDLSEEFLAFLLPHQAKELGVYMQYLCVTKMRHFLRKLEMYFSKQPQQMKKVYDSLTRLAEQSINEPIDQTIIRSVILPLLKSSSLLTEYFLQLFPCEQPPLIECSDNKDFEKVDCGEFDECGTHVQNVDDDGCDWETVEIPDVEDPFGGDNCPCSCHSSVSSSVSTHCFSCGIKFINGRVFIHSGKVLRPAQLVVEGTNKKEIIERIAKKTTDVKEYEEKASGTVRSRKRPATDNSPNKGGNTGSNASGINSSGNSGSCNLLSPTDTDEDACDLKPPTKVKSPRGVKGTKTLKTNTSRNDTSNKNNNPTEKDKDNSVQQTEDDALILDSFVVLDVLKSNENSKETESENGVLKESIDTTNKCENDDNDDDCMKTKDNPVVPSTVTQNSNEVIRDEEEDDIEYIYIDDDEDGDEVDDDCDDIEEDDAHNDDDGEEEEEFDEDEIEEVDIDEEFDREMEVEYVREGLPIKIKEEPCEVSIDNTAINNVDGNDVKMELDDVKEEIAEGFCESGSVCPEPVIMTPDPKTSDSITVSVESTSSQVVVSSNECHSSGKINNSNSVDSSKANESVIGNTTSVASVSWTKEEDKVILQTFQQENVTDQTFMTIRERLPQRSVEEIKSRFHILMLLLKRMTTNKSN